MRLFKVEVDNKIIMSSLHGLGIVMIHGGRLDVRGKLKSLESCATNNEREQFSFKHTVSAQLPCELAILYDKNLYEFNDAKDIAIQEYQRITGNILED